MESLWRSSELSTRAEDHVSSRSSFVLVLRWDVRWPVGIVHWDDGILADDSDWRESHLNERVACEERRDALPRIPIRAPRIDPITDQYFVLSIRIFSFSWLSRRANWNEANSSRSSSSCCWSWWWMTFSFLINWCSFWNNSKYLSSLRENFSISTRRSDKATWVRSKSSA